MKDIKKLTLRFFFAIEVILFTFFYYFGAQGLQALKKLRKNNLVLQSELDLIQGDVEKIQNQIKEWDLEPFYKEKVAREQLHMANSSEELYKWPK